MSISATDIATVGDHVTWDHIGATYCGYVEELVEATEHEPAYLRVRPHGATHCIAVYADQILPEKLGSR